MSGPLFPNTEKKPMLVVELDMYFHKVLKEVQQKYPSVILDSVNVEEDFSISWSLRWVEWMLVFESKIKLTFTSIEWLSLDFLICI